MKTKFFQVCVGVTMVLFATGFLIRSIQPANASPAAEKISQSPEGTGEIMMSQVVAQDGYRVVLVWNTVTGKSAAYTIGTTSMEKIRASHQLPLAPLE